MAVPPSVSALITAKTFFLSFGYLQNFIPAVFTAGYFP
jgi:hypothetical protein